MANDFSSDSACVALYRCENGALPNDSIGSNTLTNSGMTADTVDYKEGAASATGNSSSYMRLIDSSLSLDFPFKNGESNNKITACMWAKSTSLASNKCLISKFWIGSANGDSFDLNCNAGSLSLRIWSNLSSELYTYGTALSTGIWYHITFTYDDSDKSYRIRVWDDNAGALLDTDLTGTGTKNIYSSTSAYFAVGAMNIYNSWQGTIDEVVVFNEIKSVGVIDQIRSGTYSGGGAGSALLLGSDF